VHDHIDPWSAASLYGYLEQFGKELQHFLNHDVVDWSNPIQLNGIGGQGNPVKENHPSYAC